MDFTDPDAINRHSAEGAGPLTGPSQGPESLAEARMNHLSGVPAAGDGAPSGGPVLVIPPAPKRKPGQIWVQRIFLVVFVLFCLEIGIILAVLPWTSLWAHNSLLVPYPRLHEFLMLDFVRGLITGLGLVDIWMGVAEAVNYREG